MGHRHLPIRYLSIPSVADTLAAPRPGIRRAAVLPRFTHIQTRHARRILGHIAPLIAHAHSESARSVGGAFAYMLQILGGRLIRSEERRVGNECSRRRWRENTRATMRHEV